MQISTKEGEKTGKTVTGGIRNKKKENQVQNIQTIKFGGMLQEKKLLVSII